MMLSRILKIIAVIGVLVLITIALLPTLISSKTGQELLSKWIYEKSGIEISTENIQASWSGPQQVKGLHLVDHEGHVVIDIEKGELETSLIGLILDPKTALKGNLVNLNANFKKLDFAIQDLQGSFHIISNGALHLQLQGNTLKGNEKGDLSIALEFDPSQNEPFTKLDARLSKFPVAALDSLLEFSNGQKDNLLTSILGKEISLNISPNSEKSSQFKIDIESEQINATLLGKIENNTLSLKPDAPIRYIFSDEALEIAENRTREKSLPDLPQIYLVRPVELALLFEPLQIPLQAFSSEKLPHIEANVTFTPVTLQKVNSPDFLTLNNLKLTLSSRLEETPKIAIVGFLSSYRPRFNELPFTGQLTYLNRNEIQLEINFEEQNRLVAQISLADGVAQGTLLIKEGSLFDENGGFVANLQNFQAPFLLNAKQESLKLTADGNVRFFHMDEPGSIQGSLQLGHHFQNGLFACEIRDKILSLSTSGSLQENTLYLEKEFQASLLITPEVANGILARSIPLLNEAISSEDPVSLSLSPIGFSLPLHSPRTLNISSGVLNLGKVRFKNQGKIADWLSVLKAAATESINIWITPAYFSISNGLIDLKRVDMLVLNAYPLALWGNADLAQNQINLTVGLSGSALSRALNLSSSLAADYMMQFPITGTFNNVTIDKKRASAKVAGLMAELNGTPPGIVLGTVLQIAGGLGEDKPPPPTTDPLPWGLQKQENTPSSPLKPLKKIEKGASSLLKSLFS